MALKKKDELWCTWENVWCICLDIRLVCGFLGSVEQGLVLHVAHFRRFNVQLRKQKTTDFYSMNFLPFPVNINISGHHVCDCIMCALLTPLMRDQCCCTLHPFTSLSVCKSAECDLELSICCYKWMTHDWTRRRRPLKYRGQGHLSKFRSCGLKKKKNAWLTFLLDHLRDAEGLRGNCRVTNEHNWSRCKLQKWVLSYQHKHASHHLDTITRYCETNTHPIGGLRSLKRGMKGVRSEMRPAYPWS